MLRWLVWSLLVPSYQQQKIGLLLSAELPDQVSITSYPPQSYFPEIYSQVAKCNILITDLTDGEYKASSTVHSRPAH